MNTKQRQKKNKNENKSQNIPTEVFEKQANLGLGPDN